MDFKLSRNVENKGKKRPVCLCGTEMTFVYFRGYYDKRHYWICENPKCDAENQFKPDTESRGAYS